ncbi:MAG: hypothetical protein RIC34_08900 [Parvibaculum sp.]|uniref:hypothetical protein n=1 Tax=Parvibaculum sp. TaxID=2024848 RepID=UPI0032EEA85B
MTLVKAPAKTAFPIAAAKKALTDGLLDAIASEAAIKGYAVPSKPAELAKAAVHVDSLLTVDILCAVEPIIGFELPQHVVKTGGYSSIEAAVTHVLAKIEREWNKKYGVKP